MCDPVKHIERERRAVEAQIREAFRGVTREGGVSWSESTVIDGDGSDRTEEEARALDRESRWEDLVDDPNWIHEPGIGGFCFLDAIGFRYYIAPAIIRCIREDGGDSVSHALGFDSEMAVDLYGALNAQQAHVIARFIRLMIAVHKGKGDDISGMHWIDAYRKHWRQKDRGTPLDL